MSISITIACPILSLAIRIYFCPFRIDKIAKNYIKSSTSHRDSQKIAVGLNARCLITLTKQFQNTLCRLSIELRASKAPSSNEYRLKQTSGANHGDGFQGVMVRVTIEGRRLSMSNDQLTVVCKMPPASEARRRQSNTAVVFRKEIYVYERLLPALVSFQESKGIQSPDGFFEFPKCCGTYANEETGDYAIVMEDLRTVGYEMWNKYESLDFQHARLAVSELGRFHAMSFVLRDQKPDLFAEFKRMQADTVRNMLDNDISHAFLDNNYDTAIGTLDANETELIGKMKHLKEAYLKKMTECTAEGAAEPFSVINHGDFWNNNVMYQYTTVNGKQIPSGIRFIDWQITQCCSPAMDLVYFLFSSTEHELRRQHYDRLVDAYYESCSTTIRRLGSDADRLFRFEDLTAQMKRFAQYGFIMALIAIPFIVVKATDIPDLSEFIENAVSEDSNSEIKGFVPNDDQVYRQRTADVIRDFFDRNYDL